jgi:lysine/ornithine N-monooxygenase
VNPPTNTSNPSISLLISELQTLQNDVCWHHKSHQSWKTQQSAKTIFEASKIVVHVFFPSFAHVTHSLLAEGFKETLVS